MEMEKTIEKRYVIDEMTKQQSWRSGSCTRLLCRKSQVQSPVATTTKNTTAASWKAMANQHE